MKGRKMVKYRLSRKAVTDNGITLCEILANIHSNKIDLYGKTHIFTVPFHTDKSGNKRELWKDGKIVTPKKNYGRDEDIRVYKIVSEARDRLDNLTRKLEDKWSALLAERTTPGKDWLQNAIDGKRTSRTMLDVYGEYIESPKLKVTGSTRRQYRTVLNNLRRYEKERGTTLEFDNMTPEAVIDIETFYVEFLGNSPNTASRRIRHIRTFIRWANGLNREWPIEPLTDQNPFDRISITKEIYGTPFYLTIEERNLLAAAELPRSLSVQRDIFIFQCMVGCRVSDLITLTPGNIMGDAIEYIPRKTISENPRRVRVPLNSRAMEIVERYKGGAKLLPFISEQKYNDSIKEMLRRVGITRMVTVLNPKTREEERRPICDVASSHMARRTFIGNLYKKVKDPNLVGKLSGHSENSRSFSRYREIDDDMARELVDMLE